MCDRSVQGRIAAAAMGRQMHAIRGRIATDMWETYQFVLTDRSRRRAPPEWQSSNSELSESSGIDDIAKDSMEEE